MTSNNPPALQHSVPTKVRWGVGDVGLAISALGVTIVVGSIIGTTDAAAFAVSLGGYLLILAVIVHASFRRGQRSLARDFFLRFRPIDLVIGLIVGSLARTLSALLVIGLVALTGHTPTQGNLVLSPEPLWIVLNGVLIAALVAPFVEELFLRGLALQAVRNIVLRWRNRVQPAEPEQQKRAIVISVIVSSVLFALLHSGQSADAVVAWAIALSTLLLGAVNAVLVYTTGRLGPAIVAHIVFNGSAVVLGLLG